MAEGIRRGDPGAEIRCLPMADGGEGTARALADATGGTMLTASAHDPLGRPVQAGFALLGDGRTAVVETAAASGLALLRPSERDPKATTSYGTGELIRAALDAGAETIIVGLGGSATNDAGCGLLQALGVRLLDHDGRDVRPGGAALAEVERVDLSGLDRRLGDVHVIAACDVTNPLTGPEGASAVFGPQKGASREDVTLLDGAPCGTSRRSSNVRSLNRCPPNGMAMAEKSKRPWLNHRLLATVPVLTTVPARPSPIIPEPGRRAASAWRCSPCCTPIFARVSTW